jgi:antitoxin CptB
VDDRALERMKWKSRRGLLELDIVFDRFWKGAGTTMDAAQVAALEKLLRLPDNDLLDLVMRRTETADAGIRGMVEVLRAA